jgi:hypothetical protein
MTPPAIFFEARVIEYHNVGALSWEALQNGLRERVMAVGEIEALNSQNLIIVIEPNDITISYKIAWPMTLGSKSREKDLRRRFKARLQRWSPEKITDADNGQ